MVVPWPRPLACFDGENLAERESKCLARSDQYQDNSNLRAAAKAASACLSSQLLLQHEHRHGGPGTPLCNSPATSSPTGVRSSSRANALGPIRATDETDTEALSLRAKKVTKTNLEAVTEDFKRNNLLNHDLTLSPHDR